MVGPATERRPGASAPARRSSRGWLLFGPPLLAAALVSGIATYMTTGRGALALGAADEFLEYYAGVFTLVGLTGTVVWGLIATGRTFLGVRQRILAQTLHRAISTVAVGFLVVHIAFKLMEGHTTWLGLLVPAWRGEDRFVGLGNIAADLMIIVMVTGVARGRFAGTRHPWRWRLLHSLAYLSWPAAMVHGLESGRSAADWVTVSYAVCAIVVGAALFVRVFMAWARQLAGSRGGAGRSPVRALGVHVATRPSGPSVSSDLTRTTRASTSPARSPASGETAPGVSARSIPSQSVPHPPQQWAPARPAVGAQPTVDLAAAADAVQRRRSPSPGRPRSKDTGRRSVPRNRPAPADPLLGLGMPASEVPDEQFWSLIRGES